MKPPQVKRVRAKVHEKRRFAARGPNGSIHVGRQQAGYAAALLETEHGCGVPSQHRGTIRGASLRPKKYGTRSVKHIEGEVIAIGPNAQLRVVVEVWQYEGIPVIAAGRVIGGRHCDALQERSGTDRELSRDPAIGHLVVLDNGIAVIIALAPSAKACPESIAGRGPHQLCTRSLVKYSKLTVDPLNVLRCAHNSICVGGCRIDHKAELSLA